MEGDVTSGVLVIGREGRDGGEQDEGKGEEGESLQQPKTIQRRERGGGGARNPFTLSQRPLHIIFRHVPDNPGYPLPVFTLRYPLSHSTPPSPSCDYCMYQLPPVSIIPSLASPLSPAAGPLTQSQSRLCLARLHRHPLFSPHSLSPSPSLTATSSQRHHLS